ncbi:hypothetical protein AYO45_05310 [Gammaproteobacteria bacterium SCGC AG-212-F23]|nr:hypothetical protein AYO45_05310 [Gammaproteobacteria bacterium SCGC AG-212-F23]
MNKNRQSAIMNAACYANGYNPLIAWTPSIGFRPNALKYANRFNHLNLGEEFLINSYTLRGDIENHGSLEIYTSDSELTMLSKMDKRERNSHKISLPDSIPLNISLAEAIFNRRSIATYTGDSIGLPHLATVLRAANGVSSQAIVRSNSGGKICVKLRTISSGGGLYPVSLFVIVLNIKGLTRGIYEYLPTDDALYLFQDEKHIRPLLSGMAITDEQISFSRANYILLMVGHPWKSMRKYGNKGLRFILQEIGSISQNVHLSNIGLGLGSIDCGGFYENEFNDALHFDGINQSILHTIIAGIAG